jgi:hypothetical protein
MKKIAVLLSASIFLSSCGDGGSSGTIAGIWAIDLTTGDRTQLTALDGTDRTPRGMAFDATGDKAYLITAFQVIVVDAATGVPTVIASPTLGAGPDFVTLQAIAIDPANNRAFVFDSPGAVLVVDLVTGDRTVLSDGSTGTGPTFAGGAAAMVFDPVQGLLFVATELTGNGDSVLSVHPTTGERSALSDSATGTGPAFSFGDSLSIAADFVAGLVYVAQASTVFEVDLSTGDRTLLRAGPTYRSAVAADAANTRVLQVSGGALLAIDVVTTGVTTISDASTGTGPLPAEPRGQEIDAARTRVLVAAYVFE